MTERYRVEYRHPDGTVTELVGSTDRTEADASAASWAQWLRGLGKAGTVVLVNAASGTPARMFVLDPVN